MFASLRVRRLSWGGKKSEVKTMTIKKALQKIVERHGYNTYGEISFTEQCNYTRRLDLEYAIRVRDEYEHDSVYNSTRPMPNNYRLSQKIFPGETLDIVEYYIYYSDPNGEIKLYATVTIYRDEEYKDREWAKTFHETKYPRSGIPWWKK